LVGSLDTKGEEYAFARDTLVALGVGVVVVDTGVLGPARMAPDVAAGTVAAAGGSSLSQLRRAADRAGALSVMARGAAAVLKELYDNGRLQGALALGGSGNTSVAASAFASLPFGVPKVVLTTMLGGDIGGLVAGTDLALMGCVTDVAGLNRLSRAMIANAAAAVAGMVTAPPAPAGPQRPVVAASMIGLTTNAVTAARRHLEQKGYEVVVFHMTGPGGRTMESLIDQGLFAGVLDLTTSELANEVGGGICSAGPTRLTTAARRGIPQVVGPGGLDMVNFGRPATVPGHFRHRPQHSHSDEVTLVRTDSSMAARLAGVFIDRLSPPPGSGPGGDAGPGAGRPGPGYRPTVIVPSGGFSALDRPGRAFFDPAADDVFRAALARGADPDRVRLVPVEGDMDSPEVGTTAARLLHEAMRHRPDRPGTDPGGQGRDPLAPEGVRPSTP
jgi:uncharacterized protein (UPF0261 family)